MVAVAPNDAEVVERLRALGFLDPNVVNPSPAGLQTAIFRLQRHYGLTTDGELGPLTRRALFDQRVCAVPEQMGGNFCRWDKAKWDGFEWTGDGVPERLDITWSIAAGVPREYQDSLIWAWQRWAEVCAINPVFIQNAAVADIVFTTARIDGASGTLAWAELPCGRDRQLESRIDASEVWHLDPTTPPTRGRIHLGGVMCHEIGHLLGLPHDPTGARSLLDPSYGPDVLTPQAWDIQQAQFRYGPAFDDETPEPTPPGDEPAEVEATVKVGEATYRGTLAKV